MTLVERWMLPDGIEEILPPEAEHIEHLRRRLLDLFGRWGYELVMPPMMEFTDSLVVGLGKDVDLLTFKVTDQLSGRSMGIRADMTPQIARIDAHSLKRTGANRLCYAGHVLKTQMKNALATRTPMQVGIELYGEPGLDADVEVVSLLLDMIGHAKLQNMCLDLGHVGIYRALAAHADFSAEQEVEYFQLLQAKATTEIKAWVAVNVQDAQLAEWLLALPRLTGGVATIQNAREILAGAPAEVHAALDELDYVAQVVQARFPDGQLYFDLSELTGYHYLTGLGFAVFAEGWGTAVARGGRYDRIGEVFGRSRSATGFTADLVALYRLGNPYAETVDQLAIFAPANSAQGFWLAVQQLREQGENVVTGMGKQSRPLAHQSCNRILVEEQGEFVVRPLTLES